MPKKTIRDRSHADNFLPHINFKPPIPDFNTSSPSFKLKDKVTNLVQMQIKSNQSNQNFVNLEKQVNIHQMTNSGDEKKQVISIFISTKYDIVSEVAIGKHFKLVGELDDWNILWVDGAINTTRAFTLKRHQKVNHFPGMIEISRKDKLQKNLKIMQRYFPMDYNIFPKTWSLPAERLEILNYLRERSEQNRETFIIKPACSSQGRGIILVSDVKAMSIMGNIICQSYISNPFLIDGFKFDLRIYVLLTSCDPFRIYIYEEGLARFATHAYEKPNGNNINNVYMHLTNYSVQRNSENYNTNEISGTKRRLSTIYDWLIQNGYDAESIWKSIDDVIIKTMLCANNAIQHNYTATFPDQYRTSACFELLGFDIILDETMKPYVLEVNHSPSLETDTALDHSLKSQLLHDTFNLINSAPVNLRKITELERMRTAERLYWSRNKYMSSRKAAFEFRRVLSEVQTELERYEMENRNGYRLLYPIYGQTERYQRFYDFNCEHHRNFFNRCVLLDESEHKRFIELQKESLPRVIKRSTNTLDLSKLYKQRLRSGDYSKSTRSYSGMKDSNRSLHNQLNFLKNKDFGIPKCQINNQLLDNSKKSLQRILSNKNNEVTSTNTDLQNNLIAKNSHLRKSHSLTRAEDTEASSYHRQTIKKSKAVKRLKHAVINKIGEVSNITSVSSEWDSSLCSNKLQHLTNIVIPDDEFPEDMYGVIYQDKKSSESLNIDDEDELDGEFVDNDVDVEDSNEIDESQVLPPESDEAKSDPCDQELKHAPLTSIASDQNELPIMNDSIGFSYTVINDSSGDEGIKRTYSSQRIISLDDEYGAHLSETCSFIDETERLNQQRLQEVNGNNDKSNIISLNYQELQTIHQINKFPSISSVSIGEDSDNIKPIIYLAEIQEVPSGIYKLSQAELFSVISMNPTYRNIKHRKSNFHYNKYVEKKPLTIYHPKIHNSKDYNSFKQNFNNFLDHFISNSNTEKDNCIRKTIVDYLNSYAPKPPTRTRKHANAFDISSMISIPICRKKELSLDNDISFVNEPIGHRFKDYNSLMSSSVESEIIKTPRKSTGKIKRSAQSKEIKNSLIQFLNIKEDKCDPVPIEIDLETKDSFPLTNPSKNVCQVNISPENLIDQQNSEIESLSLRNNQLGNYNQNSSVGLSNPFNENYAKITRVKNNLIIEKYQKMRILKTAWVENIVEIYEKEIEIDEEPDLEQAKGLVYRYDIVYPNQIIVKYLTINNKFEMKRHNIKSTKFYRRNQTRQYTWRSLRHIKVPNYSINNQKSTIYVHDQYKNFNQTKYRNVLKNKVKLSGNTTDWNTSKTFKLLETWSDIANCKRSNTSIF